VTTDIIRRAQQGDAAVIGALYEQYRVSIFRYLYYRVGNHQTAEDLTSETFVRMLRFLRGFHPLKATFQAWLFQIAKNLVADHFRKQGNRESLELEDERLKQISSNRDDPAAVTEQGLSIQQLRSALNTLNDEQRDVIVLRFLSGLPISETARALNKSEDSIKGLQRRALATLRQALWEVKYG
jgi:RNA polymerase sigma-70 factor (ECF subfamily)